MKYSILSPAEDEFKEAVYYYNSQSEGLGFEFALEIEKTLERIVQHPDAWNPISENTRQCRCKRFPYGIIYCTKTDEIVIVAIMHLHKEPFVWQDRLQSSP